MPPQTGLIISRFENNSWRPGAPREGQGDPGESQGRGTQGSLGAPWLSPGSPWPSLGAPGLPGAPSNYLNKRPALTERTALPFLFEIRSKATLKRYLYLLGFLGFFVFCVFLWVLIFSRSVFSFFPIRLPPLIKSRSHFFFFGGQGHPGRASVTQGKARTREKRPKRAGPPGLLGPPRFPPVQASC